MNEIAALHQMGEALKRCTRLDNASMRTALYIAQGVDPADIQRLDGKAVETEYLRRKLFPAHPEGAKP